MKKGIQFILAIFITIHSIAQTDQNFQVKSFKPDAYSESVSMFIKADKNLLLDFLKTHKGKYKYHSGGYHGITIPSTEVKNLLSQSFVKGSDFTLHRPVTLNDTMRVRDNINPVHAGQNPLDTAYTGKGVIIGMIDTGLDFLHPDFQDANGNTRVLRVWDQTFAFDAQFTPAFYGYGQVWDSSHINAGNCPSIDGGNAHGTTVTGTAAGNGFANGRHKGAAPDANLIIVRSNFNAANWLGTVADAVDYIYKVADSLNMPCVINASLGDYLGSHDGRDPAAKFIDSLIAAKPGRLMICAAGNSGNIGNYHLRHDVNPLDTNFTWFTYNASSALGYGSVFFEGYADTADFNNVYYSIGANLSSGSFSDRGRTSFVNVQDHLGTLHTEQIINGGNVIATVDFYAELQGDVYLFQGHIAQPDSSNYNFRFMTTGNGAIDIWSTSVFGYSNMVNSGLPNSSTLPEIANYVAPDSSKIIVSSFSCGQNTILVGNYYALAGYTNYSGNYQNMMQSTGTISINSSRGPARDMRVKPEISASGDVHLSAAPLSMITWMIANEPHKVDQGGMHIRNGGTSMASPVVAGIAALALEKCPMLTSDEFREMIIGTAKSNSITGAVPNMSYGYGHVDAFAALVESNFTPSVPFTALCPGDSVELIVNGNNSSYLWSTGDTTPTIFANSIDTFSVQLRNEYGCKASLDSIITYNITPITPTITIDTMAGFLVSSPALTYQWMFDGDTIVGATNQQYDFNIFGNGVYHVYVTDVNGCTSFAMEIFAAESVEELSSSNITVYPNPASEEINIVSDDIIESVFIYDVIGKLIISKKINSNSTKIDISKIERGTYIFEINSNEKLQIQKIIIE